MEVLFSFGTSEQFPFQGGYIIINASDKISGTSRNRLVIKKAFAFAV